MEEPKLDSYLPQEFFVITLRMHHTASSSMNKDLYALLGVKRTATNDEIRRAYRKLAKDLHPDQNKNDKKSEEQFKKVSAAFAVLGNPDKRKRYDAGEIDAMGNERANPFYRD